MDTNNFIVKPLDNENYEISEKVTLKDLSDNDVVVQQPRGVYNLPALHGEKARLLELLSQASMLIEIIENSKM